MDRNSDVRPKSARLGGAESRRAILRGVIAAAGLPVGAALAACGGGGTQPDEPKAGVSSVSGSVEFWYGGSGDAFDWKNSPVQPPKMNNGDLSAKEASQLMDDLGTKTIQAGG